MQLTMRPRLALAIGLGLLAVGDALHYSAVANTAPRADSVRVETPARWFSAGAQAARQAIREAGGAQRARNVIVFLGDGMGFTTVSAAHIYAGQKRGLDGESFRLSFEQFPYTALSRPYEVNQQTPDSAGTMTALMTGVKTKAGFIGIDQGARRGDCASAQGAALVSALQLAGRAGMATGAVTTTRITHATPAATYGHNPERNWEGDADLPAEAKAAGCTDFAAQLIDNARAGMLDVALGGGRARFMPAGMPDPQREGAVGQRLDGRNLIEEWLAQPRSSYVWSASGLAAVDPEPVKNFVCEAYHDEPEPVCQTRRRRRPRPQRCCRAFPRN
jgi:alkaline phosphatase